MILDSPSLFLDILINLLRCPDTSLIYAHPGGHQIAIRDFIVGQDHSPKFTRFLKYVELESSFDIFEIGGSVR